MVSTMFDCVCGRILIIVMEKVMEQGQMIWKRRLTLQNEQNLGLKVLLDFHYSDFGLILGNRIFLKHGKV